MGQKIITKNKRAFYDFDIKEVVEAGIVLKGTEIKVVRDGKAQISDAFVTIDNSLEAWINNMTIPPYEFGNIHNHEEKRKRKLLLKKEEIKKIEHRLKTDGLTCVPTKLYFKDSYVKIEIGLAKGKKAYDKRESIKKKDIERKIKQGRYE